MLEFLAWWAGATALAYTLARIAAAYMDRLPVTEYDQWCTRVDDEANGQPSLVGSRLDVVDHLTGLESEWTELDVLWLAEHSIGGVQ